MTDLVLLDRTLTEDWQGVENGWESRTVEENGEFFIYFRKGDLNARTQVDWADLHDWPVEELDSLFKARFTDVERSYDMMRRKGELEDYDANGNRLT